MSIGSPWVFNSLFMLVPRYAPRNLETTSLGREVIDPPSFYIFNYKGRETGNYYSLDNKPIKTLSAHWRFATQTLGAGIARFSLQTN